jgi:hypothetical protein
MRFRKRVVGQHEDAVTQRARRAAQAVLGVSGEAQRAFEIAFLPRVEWRGRTLYTLTCAGDFGKGPHKVNVPESLLWSLIDLRVFRCPYHR